MSDMPEHIWVSHTIAELDGWRCWPSRESANQWHDESLKYTRTDLAEAEIESLKAQPPQWISVGDRLPEEQALYLVYTADGSVMTCPKLMGHPWEVYAGQVGDITHWMPIPALKELTNEK